MTIVEKYRKLHAGWMVGQSFPRPTHIAVGTSLLETGEFTKLTALVDELHREEITARWVLGTDIARFSAIFTSAVANGTWREVGLFSVESDVERVTDGNMNLWTSDTDLTHWTEILDSGLVSKELTEKYTGLWAAKLANGASASVGTYMDTSITLTAGRIYKVQAWMKKESGINFPCVRLLTASGAVRLNHNGPAMDGESEFYTGYHLATGDEVTLRCWNYLMGSSGVVYYDAISVRESGDLLARDEKDSYCTKVSGQTKAAVIQLRVS